MIAFLFEAPIITDDMIAEYLDTVPDKSCDKDCDKTSDTTKAQTFVNITGQKIPVREASVEETVKKMSRAELEDAFIDLHQDFGDEIDDNEDLALEIKNLKSKLDEDDSTALDETFDKESFVEGTARTAGMVKAGKATGTIDPDLAELLLESLAETHDRVCGEN